MNILFLSSSYSIFVKGHWQNPNPRHDLAVKLMEQGHKVYVVTPHIKGAESQQVVDGVEIFRFGKDMPLDFRKINPLKALSYYRNFQKEAAEVAKEKKIDVIHGFWAIPAGYVARKLSKKIKKPYVVELLGSDVFFGLMNPVSAKFVKSAINDADYVIADGPSLIAFAKENGCKIGESYVHGYVPIIAGRNNAIDEKLREKWGLKENEKLLMVSRIKDRIYGVEYLLEAVKDIKKEIDVKVLLVGGGGEYKGVLDAKIDELGIGDIVVFTGHLDKGEYCAAMRLSDIYVTPSLSDSTSVALLEAMAIGMPVIASDVGDNSYWIKDGVNGKIVKAKSAEEIANAAVYLLTEANLEEISERNKKKVTEKCDWEEIIQNYEKIYKKVINKKP